MHYRTGRPILKDLKEKGAKLCKAPRPFREAGPYRPARTIDQAIDRF
jgi:hypothetical protein